MNTTWMPGLLDGWMAAPSVDEGVTLQTSFARRALLDLDGNSRFDELDITSFLDAFDNLQGQDELSFSRWDLNGDSRTGGDGRASFDLAANVLPSFTTVSQAIGTNGSQTTRPFDERHLTDREILCYYAWSPLYQGDPVMRETLLPTCDEGAGYFVEIELPERVTPGDTTPVTVRAGSRVGGATTYLQDVEIDVYANGGDFDIEEGLTDGSGTFTTTLVMDGRENDVTVEAHARFADGESAGAEKTVLRPDEIRILEQGASLFVNTSYAVLPAVDGRLVIMFNNEHYEDSEAQAPFQFQRDVTGSGQYDDMTGSGDAYASIDARLLLFDGNRFLGARFEGSINGSATLSNPDAGLGVDSDALVDFQLDFVVWGEPAEFTLTGSIDADTYTVGLYGPSVATNCTENINAEDGSEREDVPCSTISDAGELPPGVYTLEIIVKGSAALQSDCQGAENCAASGTRTYAGSMNVALDVGH